MARQQRLERELVTQQRQAFAIQDARDTAEDAYERALALYTRHIVDLYEKGETSRVAILASIRDVSGAIDGAIVLKRLADYDREVIEEYRQAAEHAAAGDRAYDAAIGAVGETQSHLDEVNIELASFEEPAKVVDLDRERTSVRTGASGTGDVVDPDGSAPAPDAPPPTVDRFFTTTPLPGIGIGGGTSPDAPAPLPGFGTLPAFPSAPPIEMPDGLKPTGQIEVGVASWYGPGFDGNTTANGETYDMYAMTAAHKTLPFDTWVKVTAETGRSVFVRINDRGPYVDGRIIDLSYAAAQAVGISGIGNVQVEVYAPGGAAGAARRR